MNDEAAGRIDALVSRYRLSDGQRLQLRSIVSFLSEDARAPTSVRAPELVVDAHLADSLVALELDVLDGRQAIVDIGAGAGLPGLPLAVALTGCQVILVDGQARKCAFLERLIAAASIDNALVSCVRVEQWPDGVGRYDVALARAVASQPVVLEYAAPLLRIGGALVDWRGRRDRDEEEAALRAAAELGLEREGIAHAEPFAGARDHHLHVFVKTAVTPARYPRRAGMARKRPLG